MCCSTAPTCCHGCAAFNESDEHEWQTLAMYPLRSWVAVCLLHVSGQCEPLIATQRGIAMIACHLLCISDLDTLHFMTRGDLQLPSCRRAATCACTCWHNDGLVGQCYSLGQPVSRRCRAVAARKHCLRLQEGRRPGRPRSPSLLLPIPCHSVLFCFMHRRRRDT